MKNLARWFAANVHLSARSKWQSFNSWPRRRFLLIVGFASFLSGAALASMPANAETGEIRLARQLGLGFLQLMVMEDGKLIEKRAKAAGLGDLKVNWSVFSNASAMNDALISGQLDFATAGIPAILTLWSRTRGKPQEIRGALGVNVMPMLLNTRNPAVKTIRDFTDQDRIALTGVKVAAQAIVLQMATAEAFGQQNYAQLDRFTVTMGHPDAMAALMSGRGEITAHFASPPFQELELENPQIRTVLSSEEVVGKMNFSVLFTSAKFHNENPRTYAAVLAAFQDATEWINEDRARAVSLYLRMSKSKDTVEHLMSILRRSEFTTTPHGFMKFATFMNQIGTLQEKPATWRDIFFPEAHHLPGD